MDGLPVITTKCVSAAQQRVARRRSQLTTTDTVADCASRKFGAAQGSNVFFQMNRKGRWACGPCLNLVTKFAVMRTCASTLRTRKSESQYRQGLILARSGSPSFVAIVQSADEG